MSRFYAMNFFKLNLKIELPLQKMFDLLKIVHTINLDSILDETVVEMLKKISKVPEIQKYLHYYRTYGYDIYLGELSLEKIEPKLREIISQH